MNHFLLASASEALPLLIALLVGSLLLVGGVLLFLLPQRERRKASLRGRSRTPVPTLPGYRIRREQAAVPRQFLAVPRIAALAPRPPEPPSPPPPPPPAREAIPSAEQTIPALSAGEPPDAELPTLTLPPPEPPQPIAEEITLHQPAEAAPPPEAAAVPAVSAEPQVEAPAEVTSLATVLDSEQTVLADDNAIQSAGVVEAPTVPEARSHIRKARLADVLAEPALERPYSKEAQLVTPPAPAPEPQPPQSAARRAHLVGFPAPGHLTGEPAPDPSGTAEASQETDAVSSTDAAEAETVPEAQAGEETPVEDQAAGAPLSQTTTASSPAEAGVTPAVRIVCFGTVDMLLDGAPLSPLDSRFRASREFELLAFLAQSAAQRRQTFVDRSTITEALLAEGLDEEDDEIDGDGEDYRRSPLGGWKYRLCRRLRRYGLPDNAWLETRADGALRLRADVQIDLVDFLQVSGQLRKARDLVRRGAGQQIEREMVFEWLQHLQHLYRDRGEFAEQFKFQEWTQEPRRRYRNIYWHALFYAAELQASLGERQMAIQVAEELLEQEEVEAEVVYESLLTWLREDGNKPDLSRWLNKYREWYASAHDDRSLDRDRPELIARLTTDAPQAAPAKKPSA
jgi:hypothetical protein